MMTIKNITARQILDSRGNPTVEVDILLANGSLGRAAVPSGASTGSYEAVEIRDNIASQYLGKSVYKAVENVNKYISSKLVGSSFENHKELDQLLISIDGTDNKSKLGANAILGVSMAYVHAQSNALGVPLYELLLNDSPVLPIPMMNVINGGSHADNNIDIQEFMIFPVGAESFSHSIQMGVEVFHNLKTILNCNSFSTAVGDEGGFAPNLESNEHAIEILIESIYKSGFTPGKDIYLALDVAASELYDSKLKIYHLKSDDSKLSSEDMIEFYARLCKNYPILSIEDGLDESDWEGWSKLYKKLGNKIQLVGDDLTVTNTSRLQRAINEKAMNSILIKLNQIGTITETIETIQMAKNANFGAIISHRSGETEDTTIADFSVAMGMGQIKTGSVSRTDRTAKYNQLIRIEERLGSSAIFGSKSIDRYLNEINT